MELGVWSFGPTLFVGFGDLRLGPDHLATLALGEDEGEGEGEGYKARVTVRFRVRVRVRVSGFALGQS